MSDFVCVFSYLIVAIVICVLALNYYLYVKLSTLLGDLEIQVADKEYSNNNKVSHGNAKID